MFNNSYNKIMVLYGSWFGTSKMELVFISRRKKRSSFSLMCRYFLALCTAGDRSSVELGGGGS